MVVFNSGPRPAVPRQGTNGAGRAFYSDFRHLVCLTEQDLNSNSIADTVNKSVQLVEGGGTFHLEYN